MNACLLNEVMSCKASKKTNIVPGMGATRFVGSDRYAMVVTYVMSPKRIRVAHLFDEDEDKFVENEDGMQVLPEDLLEKFLSRSPLQTYSVNSLGFPFFTLWNVPEKC